ncbi:MAG: hypothetical protein MRK01_04925 [Candidatus Scalindua sp.]|nr:hypothetical protein [Candidatus Scalindua sp.]
MAADKTQQQEENARSKIGRHIVYFALAIIGILGISALIVIWRAEATSLEKRLSAVKDILSILLPVVGTWVGTVLAFYFSKENFATAAQQTSDLVRQLTPEEKLKSIKAKSVWISMTNKKTVSLTLDKEEKEIHLKKDILDLLTKTNRNRLPIVTASGNVKYLIHRSIIDKFISEQAISGKLSDEKTAAKLTLEEFLQEGTYKQISQSFGIVNIDASLIDVKAQMDSIDNCSDVFATEDGTKNGNASGWVTNGILQEHSKV